MTRQNDCDFLFFFFFFYYGNVFSGGICVKHVENVAILWQLPFMFSETPHTAVFASGCLSDHLFSDVFSLNICILSVSITITIAFVTMKKCCVYIIVIITGHDDGAG